MSNRVRQLIVENKGLLIFIILMSVFRSSLADWNSVPTGSMKPTIIEGDRIVINKVAYDLRLPFSDIPVTKFADPVRGDIIVFNSRVSNKRLVKRVVGIPGDEVSMTDNVLTVNGNALRYTESKDVEFASVRKFDLVEDLLGVEHSILINTKPSKASNFLTVAVPNGMYLVLGDNRDNSVDSRYIGFVPRGEIIGRSRTVAMSFDYDDYYLLRKERFLKTL